MKKITTRFGEIKYNPQDAVLFPKGIIGFENLRHFIVMPNKKEGPLFWIQSIDDPEIAFVVTNPTNFFLDYQIAPDDQERKTLEIEKNDDYYLLSIVTVPPSREITLNLAAPIIFSPKTNRALQVILEDSSYDFRTPLPKV
ncbi:MAG: flagellar assembly protein FliW [Desulfobulbaceae bacterium]|nr:flagellar assembly protein FliW [Desulfobulbaceae bacterium]